MNPAWCFEGSVYVGCRDPHLPLAYGYAKALLEADGHEVMIADAQLGFVWLTGEPAMIEGAHDDTSIRDRLEELQPEVTVIGTAPGALGWRGTPPELRVPMRTIDRIRDVAGVVVVVGPHASTTPAATLRKLGAHAAVAGECEEVLASLARTPPSEWHAIDGVALPESAPRERTETDLRSLPALRWPREVLALHRHHHHRFDREPDAAGGELETSRGSRRSALRRRSLATVIDELDAMLEAGVRYVYFTDEVFAPDAKLLEELAMRDVELGVSIRIDEWSKPLLELLGRAGCVSIEAGVDAVTEKNRSRLATKGTLSTEALTDLLVHAKKHVPFVEANLLEATAEDTADLVAWREELRRNGVWTNDRTAPREPEARDAG